MGEVDSGVVEVVGVCGGAGVRGCKRAGGRGRGGEKVASSGRHGLRDLLRCRRQTNILF